jgi:WD40 repeat protein
LYRKTVRRFFQISGHIDIISRGRAFSPDGTLYTEAVGASVIVYNIKENGTAKSLPQPPYPANTSNILNRLRKITNNTVPPVPMCIAMSNQNIAVKYRNGLVACWQYGLIESKLVHIESALNTDHMIGVSSRGNFIAYLSNKTMLIRGVGKTNAEIAYHLEMGGVFTRYLPRPSSIAFSPDAGLLAVALTWDTPNEPIKSVHELRIFEVRKNKESSRMVYLSMCDALVFSHDGKLLAFKTDDTLTVWNVYRKRVCFEHTRQRSGQHFLAFSPDSKLLVVVTSGYLSFEIADIATGSFHKIWVHGPSAASMELYGPCTFRQDGSVVAFSHTPGQKGPRSYIDRPRRYTELATAADIEEILSNNLAKQFRSGFTDDFDAFLEVMPGLDVREYTPDPESEVKYEEQLTPGGTRFEISYPA